MQKWQEGQKVESLAAVLTVPQDLHDLIKEIADARGVPMSSVAVELLSEMQPALEAALPIFKKQKQISDNY